MFSFTKKGIKFRKYIPSELKIRQVSTDRIYLPVGEIYLESGDRVQAGQSISTLEGRSVVSSVDGRFAGTVTLDLPTGAVRCAMILSDSAQAAEFTYNSLKMPTLEELVSAAEKMKFDGLTDRIKAIPGRQVMIRALDKGPDQVTDSGILCNCLKEILSCAAWLEAISGQEITVYTNNSSVKMYVRDHSAEIHICSVSRKYPSTYWLDQKLKKCDAVVLDVAEVRGLFHCIAYGQPPLSVLLSVCRPGAQVEICEVPVGTPVSALFDEVPEHHRFALNGVLQGLVVSAKTPVTLGDNAVTLVSDRTERSVSCIGCGRCVRACPVGIAPMFVHEQWTNRDENISRQYGADRCIACGACSYVCPSKLPLTQRIRAMAEVCEHE